MDEQVDDLFRTLRLLIFKILVANIFRPLLYRLIDYQFVVFVRQFLVVVSNDVPPYAEQKAPSVKNLLQLEENFPLFDYLHYL